MHFCRTCSLRFSHFPRNTVIQFITRAHNTLRQPTKRDSRLTHRRTSSSQTCQTETHRGRTDNRISWADLINITYTLQVRHTGVIHRRTLLDLANFLSLDLGNSGTTNTDNRKTLTAILVRENTIILYQVWSGKRLTALHGCSPWRLKD